jgi:hypothetical protein
MLSLAFLFSSGFNLPLWAVSHCLRALGHDFSLSVFLFVCFPIAGSFAWAAPAREPIPWLVGLTRLCRDSFGCGLNARHRAVAPIAMTLGRSMM